ncbi:hypothetical protein AB0F43_35350 [Kribbella sp. NPDC023972]|uniref:hypothetical protein n=1 Tax=Kribbella sp. NPDC023972 TaxID=3154795 RepID=UPI0033D5DEB2
MNLNPLTLPMAEAARETNYVVTLLVSAGVVVILAALLAIPAIRTASGAGSSGRPKRWASVATALAALVLPVFVGGQATAHAIDRLDDFTSAPDICTSDALSQDRIAVFITSPPDPDAYSASSYARCDWERSGDDDGEAAQLEIYVSRYDDSRAAGRSVQRDKDRAERDGKTVVAVQLGDEGIRRWYDGTIDSEDTSGVALKIRIDNVVLEAKFDQAESLGTPDSDKLETLATELVREIESRKPRR